ncbi:MAG: hypothetical protein M3157_04090 [Actinomycetota bacterium]|nr:hypothetical protein [Actinomycetota bacterium]
MLGALSLSRGQRGPALAYPLNYANGFLVTVVEWVAQGVSTLPFAVVETPGIPVALIGLFYLGCVPAAVSESFLPEERWPFWAGTLIVWTAL